MFGMAFQGARTGDWITSDFLPIMWGNGGELWDPTTYTAEGYVNSPEAVAALEMMRAMVADDKSVDPAAPTGRSTSASLSFRERRGAELGAALAAPPRTRPAHWSSARSDSPIAKGPQSQAAMYGCQGSGINTRSENGSRLAVPAVAHGQAAAGDHGRDRRRLPVTTPGPQGCRSVPMAAGIRGADPDRPRLLEHSGVRAAAQFSADAAQSRLRRSQDAARGAGRRGDRQQAIYDSSPNKPANAATPAPS